MSSAEDNEPAASETPVDSSTNAADSASATDAGADPEPAAADGESPAEGAAPSETNTTPEETVEVVQVNVVVTEEETPKSKIKSSDGTKAKSSDGTKTKSSDGTQAKSSDGTKVKSVASGSIDKIKSKTKPSSKTDDEGETGGEAETDDSATAITPTKSKSKTSKSSINEEAKKGSMKKVKVGFFGAGRMTDSITKGLLKSGKFQAKQLYVTKKSKRNLDYYKSQGMHVSTRGYDVFAKFACDVIFIAVNGYVIKNCFKQGGTRPLPLVTNYIPSRKRKSYVLSLVGGISLKELKVVLLNPEVSEKRYPVHFHRITMNVSVAYNLGLGALDVELDSKKCSSVVRELLQLLGKFEYVDAELMDTTCAVVGMGQAFVYYFISSLADGGFKMGLSKNVAVKMAAKTLQAAAMCLLETNKNPVDLRDACAAPTSPIIYGIALLEKQDCSSGFQMAVDAAYMRIKQLVDTDIDTRQKP